MRFSKWHAHGNVYLLTDERGLSPERVRAEVGDADGIVEVVSATESEADVVIWNPDGTTAELSGNGTRIAARWLADRTGVAEVRIRIGSRETIARVKNGDVEQELGAVTVSGPEQIEGLDVIVSMSVTRTRSWWEIQTTCRASGRCSRCTNAFQTARTSRWHASTGPAK